MFYDTKSNAHGLKHDPFKALIVPRPIGWVSSLDAQGQLNLAPYSFFNAMSDRPPYVVFGSAGRKDSVRNIEETGEFVCSLATYEMRDQQNVTSAAVPADISEFDVAGLEAAASTLVKPPRVRGAPAAFECRFWKAIDLPAIEAGAPPGYTLVIGTVVGVYIDDAFVKDGKVDTSAMQPIARLGYMDYAVVNADTTFSLP
ncbi:MAG: flavin reductase family protein, partial [Pseudomonadota bacterium]